MRRKPNRRMEMKGRWKRSWKIESVQRGLNEKEVTGLLSKEESNMVET